MEFSFTDEQRAISELAREILTPGSPATTGAEVPPVGEGWPQQEVWRHLADANLLGLSLAEDVGGSGLGMLELGLLLQETGRGLARIPAWPTLTAARVIDELGDDGLRKDVLPAVIDGEATLTVALSEPRALDIEAPRTVARRSDGGIRLEGGKTCVPFAATASAILVPAATTEGGAVLALVEPDAPGVGLQPQETTHGEPQFEVLLDGVEVGAGGLLAGPADGAAALSALVDRACVAVASVMLGVAEQALRMTADYTSEREQFGRPLSTFQTIAAQAADAYIDVEAMRSTLWQALWRLDAGRPAREAVAIAKFWASEGGERVASTAVHLHGGIGVDTDYPLHHYFLWAKELELILGSASHQLDRLGGLLAEGEPA